LGDGQGPNNRRKEESRQGEIMIPGLLGQHRTKRESAHKRGRAQFSEKLIRFEIKNRVPGEK